MESAEIEPLIEHISIFGGVDRTYIDRIVHHCDVVHKHEGELLYRENDPASEIYVILKGKIKLVYNLEENPYELIELGEGGSLGETSVIAIEPHGSSAIVTEDATLLVLSRSVLNQIHEEDPEVFTVLILNIARELARRLHQNRKTLNDIRHLIHR